MLLADRYTVGPPLGRGGMGEVYRGHDELLDRPVAIKFLLPTRDSDLAAARFRREARTAATLNDPHVVAALDFGAHESGYFLVMELVEGRSVADELKVSGPLAAWQALDVVRQAAAGLAAAHSEDIVHRDIKPGNLLLATDGTVKIADFGIARFIAETTTTLTATGQVVGTSHYLAPERALGGPAAPASDIYALGCVLYQLVTGHPPFVGDQPASILYQHVEVDPVPPSDLRPDLAGPCETLLFRMLAKDPDDRPTAAEIASGVPVLPLAKLDATTTVLHPLRRGRILVAGAAAAAVVAATVGLAVLVGPDLGNLPATDLVPSKAPGTTHPPQPSAVRTTRPPSPVVATSRTVKPSTSRSTKASTTSPDHGKAHPKKPTPKPKPEQKPKPTPKPKPTKKP